MKKFIFLDPDGTKEIGLVVIVSAHTGVIYTHQCGGTRIEHHSIEGFAVPLGYDENLGKLVKFFHKFKGSPPLQSAGDPWKQTEVEQLEAIVSNISFWQTEGKVTDYKQQYLSLNMSEIDNLTEAWIPIKTIHGSGVLVFDNSD